MKTSWLHIGIDRIPFLASVFPCSLKAPPLKRESRRGGGGLQAEGGACLLGAARVAPCATKRPTLFGAPAPSGTGRIKRVVACRGYVTRGYDSYPSSCSSLTSKRTPSSRSRWRPSIHSPFCSGRETLDALGPLTLDRWRLDTRRPAATGGRRPAPRSDHRTPRSRTDRSDRSPPRRRPSASSDARSSAPAVGHAALTVRHYTSLRVTARHYMSLRVTICYYMSRDGEQCP